MNARSILQVVIASFAVTLGGSFVCGCDKNSPSSPTTDPLGRLTLGIDGAVRHIEFGEVSCRDVRDGTLVELTGTAPIADSTGRMKQPKILVATLPRSGGWRDRHSAMVTAPDVEFSGAAYDVLTIVAAKTSGARSDTECRVSRESEGVIELVCNRATLVGWKGRAPIPPASFKVEFQCPGV